MKKKQETWEMNIFKQRLRGLMNNYGSIVAFADALGVSRQTLGYWLNGSRVPDAENLVKISKRMEVSVDWLLGLSEHNNYSDDEALKIASDYTGIDSKVIEHIRMYNVDLVDKFMFTWLMLGASWHNENAYAFYLSQAYRTAKDRNAFRTESAKKNPKVASRLDDGRRKLSIANGSVELSGLEAISYFISKSADVYKKNCELLIDSVLNGLTNTEAIQKLKEVIPDLTVTSLTDKKGDK